MGLIWEWLSLVRRVAAVDDEKCATRLMRTEGIPLMMSRDRVRGISALPEWGER
jgi:hypothetical protein